MLFLRNAEAKLKTKEATEKALTEKDLASKKELIDATLTQMKTELDKVHTTMQTLEKDREKKYTELTSHLKHSTEQTQSLLNTTNQLKSALASTKTRGAWGERMAEDVLRLTGLIEGVNYAKQKSQDFSRAIPDFTFYLPNNMSVNMDVKFPLTNYMNYLESHSETEKQNYKTQFLKDVKLRIKEVTSKDYINPQNNTVDYVLLFIPNEQVYSFIHENDPTLLDIAMQNKTIFCSPLTLYALLAVIRQAIDNFAMQERSSEMLEQMGIFKKNWEMFKDSMEKMGRRLDDASKEFTNLLTTRSNQLDKPLLKIEAIRESQSLPRHPERISGSPPNKDLPQP